MSSSKDGRAATVTKTVVDNGGLSVIDNESLTLTHCMNQILVVYTAPTTMYIEEYDL